MLKTYNSDKQFLSIIRQENYSVCNEPDGRYLYQFTSENCPKSVKPDEVFASNLMSFLRNKGIDKNLQAIGGDTTYGNSRNTGWEDGTMH